MINFRGYLTYRSREPINCIPAIFSSGGYSALDYAGNDVNFDWEDFESDVKILEDGKLEFNVIHRNPDYDVFPEFENIHPKEIATMKLIEAFYECYLTEVEEDGIYLDLIDFSLVDADGIQYDFQNLDDYNKNYAPKEE